MWATDQDHRVGWENCQCVNEAITSMLFSPLCTVPGYRTKCLLISKPNNCMYLVHSHFLLGFSFPDLSPFLCFSCFLRPVVILLLELASTMAEFSYCCCSWDRRSVHLLMSDINLDSLQGTDKVSQDVMVGGWCHTCCGWPALLFKLLCFLVWFLFSWGAVPNFSWWLLVSGFLVSCEIFNSLNIEKFSVLMKIYIYVLPLSWC